VVRVRCDARLSECEVKPVRVIAATGHGCWSPPRILSSERVRVLTTRPCIDPLLIQGFSIIRFVELTCCAD